MALRLRTVVFDEVVGLLPVARLARLVLTLIHLLVDVLLNLILDATRGRVRCADGVGQAAKPPPRTSSSNNNNSPPPRRSAAHRPRAASAAPALPPPAVRSAAPDDARASPPTSPVRPLHPSPSIYRPRPVASQGSRRWHRTVPSRLRRT